MDPFGEAANGARQLSQYPLATNTFKVLATAECTSTATGTFGTVVTPNPSYTFTQIAAGTDGTITGVSSALSIRNGGTNAIVYAASNDLPGKAEKYRCVSIGVNLKPITNFTSTSGHVYVAFVPSGEYYPYKMADSATAALLGEFLGVPYTSSGVSSAVSNLPNCRQFSIAELLASGGLEMTVPISSPRHEDWLDVASYDQFPGLAWNSVNTTSYGGTITSSYAQTAGWGTLVVFATGMPASSKVFTIQVVFHVEATPIVAGSSVNAFIPTSLGLPKPAAPDVKHRLISAITSSPAIRTKEEALKRKGWGIVKSMVGPAEKALGLAAMV